MVTLCPTTLKYPTFFQHTRDAVLSDSIIIGFEYLCFDRTHRSCFWMVTVSGHRHYTCCSNSGLPFLHMRGSGKSFNKSLLDSFSFFLSFFFFLFFCVCEDQLACTNLTLSGGGSVHGGSASWDDCRRQWILSIGTLFSTIRETVNRGNTAAQRLCRIVFSPALWDLGSLELVRLRCLQVGERSETKRISAAARQSLCLWPFAEINTGSSNQ